MNRQLTCIGCPLGCAITVTMEDGQIQSVTGNSCKRGDAYARKELTHPTRIVTSSVPVTGSKWARMVSCKTEYDVPKDRIFAVMEALRAVRAAAPVRIGDVLLENAADTGINIIATKNID